MKRCAFLSLENTEGWVIDDDLAIPPLQALGWTVDTVPWRDASIDWNQYQLVIIRSPWDYQAAPKKFFRALEMIEKSSARLVNPLEMVRWNLHKEYLFELEKKGVELVPTVRHDRWNPKALNEAFKRFNTDRIVLKPTVGANADDTFKLTQPVPVHIFGQLSQLFENRSFFIQPFMDSVVNEGEFSLMYFNGEFSHAILKVPGAGDFRVQEEHGASVVAINEPEKELIEVANHAMQQLDSTPLYARVDLVRKAAGGFALMELELIEPCLYFRQDAGAPARFAAVVDAIANN